MKYFLTKHTNHAPFPLFSAGRHTQRSSWWLQPFRARQIFSAKHTSLKHSSWIFNISRASSVPKWAEGFLPAPQGIHSQRSRSAVDHCTLMPPVDSRQHIFKFHHIFLFKIVLRIIQHILNPCSALLHNRRISYTVQVVQLLIYKLFESQGQLHSWNHKQARG